MHIQRICDFKAFFKRCGVYELMNGSNLLKSQLQMGIVKILFQNINGLVKNRMKDCKIPGVNLKVQSAGKITEYHLNLTIVTFIFYSVQHKFLLENFTFAEDSRKFSSTCL